MTQKIEIWIFEWIKCWFLNSVHWMFENRMTNKIRPLLAADVDSYWTHEMKEWGSVTDFRFNISLSCFLSFHLSSLLVMCLCVLVCVGGSGPSRWFCVDVLVAVMQISIRDLLMNANEALAVDGNKDLSPTRSSFISLLIQSEGCLKRPLAPTSRQPGTHFYISKAGRAPCRR